MRGLDVLFGHQSVGWNIVEGLAALQDELGGAYAMDVRDVSYSYTPNRPLIRRFSISIGAKDRVFVIGRNGKGKTTLLKLMAGVLEPDAGEVVSPQSAALGYYEQTNVSSLVDANTVLDEIAAAIRRGAELGSAAAKTRAPRLDEILAIDRSVRASFAAEPVLR